MTKKENFIEEVKAAINGLENGEMTPETYFSSDALDYWNGLQATGDEGKVKFTENGKLVLKYMQENKEAYNNLFKAKDIGEGMGISSRTVSGTMRKLVNDGYCEKIGENPIVYSLTNKGIEVNLEAE